VKSCVHISVCFCNQSGGGSGIRVSPQKLLSRDLARKTVRSVRLALKVVMQNDRDFVNVTLL
jgi:hypothetical protein